jgi:hypothetical protein
MDMAACCPPGGDRPLTAGERDLVHAVFGDAIDCDPVRIKRRRWFPFQPAETLMAPTGHVHFHPASSLYVDDFADAGRQLQALLLHEMTHVWQTQQRGRWYLPLMRHPLCRYDYALRPGWKLERYGIEQQAEIVRHVFLLERGVHVPGARPVESYRGILPFKGS